MLLASCSDADDYLASPFPPEMRSKIQPLDMRITSDHQCQLWRTRVLNLRENWQEHTSEDDKVIDQPEFDPVSRVERDICY